MKTWVRLIPFIFYFSIIFIFVCKTPVFSDSLDLEFSVQRGFFNQPFNLTISCEENIDQIWYTFDGRDPAKSNTFKIGNEPVELLIDPYNENMPSIAPSVVVRAVGIKNGVIITPSVTHTYIFLNAIAELSPDGIKPGPDWPDTNSTDKTIEYFDYGMDPDVLNDPRYSSQIENALMDLLSLSIVTNPENLFNPDSGIYVNGRGDGVKWERNCSLELLNPSGKKGFQINAGIRIRGGDSRRKANPKHSFRFLFKYEYGPNELKYDLFNGEGAERFSRLDLRTNQNYSWHASDKHRASKNTLVRETFSRDTQRDMGMPYTRSRMYHVYLNGVYWGVYMTQERAEENYAASYFGGDKEEYDVIKIDKNNDNKIYATNGTIDSWQRLWQATMNGLSANRDYFRIQGLDENGLENHEYEKLLDLKNFISYLLIYFYTGNYDGIVGLQWNNQKPNNFWSIYKRTNPDGFKFFIHDAEQSMASEDGITLGLNVDRTGPFEQLRQWYWFNGQELHQELVNNKEYLVTFADHVYKYFYNEGALTPQNSIVRFNTRAQEANLAIIGESARWGDGNSDRKNNPRTKDDDWQVALNDILTRYLPFRRDIVVQQLIDNGWYPDFQPPVFTHEGDTIQRTKFEVIKGYSLEILNTLNPGSQVIYTINGNDPRNIGGTIDSGAIISTSNVFIELTETSTIKARIKVADEWSALHKVKFKIFNPKSDIIITEIHYNPVPDGQSSNDDFEFIEFKNIGEKPFNLGYAFFDEGIEFTFPENTMLEQGGFLVLASNAESFKSRYGFYPFAEYNGRLDNDGELIELLDRQQNTLIRVKYNDQDLWPALADGEGYSLTTLFPNDYVNPNNEENWTNSANIHGTPGRDDIFNKGSANALSINDFQLLPNYPNPFNASTTIRYNVLKQSKIDIKVYDSLGRLITTLVNEVKPFGIHNVQFNAKGLASGLYFVRLEAGKKIRQRKIILLK